MTRNPGTHFLRYRSRILGTIVDGSGYFLRYGTKQSIVTYLYLRLKSIPVQGLTTVVMGT